MRLIFLAFLLISGPASSEVWTVHVGERQIGTLTLEEGANNSTTLTSVLDATPLGLADGTFTASSFPALTPEGRSVTQYLSAAKSTRKARNISVLTDSGRPLETRIEPPSEATPLSVVDQVVGPVLNPVEAFEQIAESSDCPQALRYYDGRRVIEISFTNKYIVGDTLRCELDYRVTDGPGHLSPFRFKSVALALQYRAEESFTLREITLSAGGFTAKLRR